MFLFLCPQKTKSGLLNSQGMSLLEVLVVLGIMAGVFILFVGRGNIGNSELKEAVRKIGTVSRDVYYRTKLYQVPYRIVIDMKTGANSKLRHQYWVEKGEKGNIDFSPESKGFSKDESILKSPEDLPGDLLFEDVEVASSEAFYTKGLVYINFLPKGSIEEVAIHIKYDDKHRWTLNFHPLTGRALIISKYIKLKDLIKQD